MAAVEGAAEGAAKSAGEGAAGKNHMYLVYISYIE